MLTQRPGTGRIDATAILAISETSNGMSVLDRYNRDATLTRIGPDIHGNLFSNNSINGLFVRVETLFEEFQTEVIDFGARFEFDTDIVHVITENVISNEGVPRRTARSSAASSSPTGESGRYQGRRERRTSTSAGRG